jgi:hypothetical protein
VIGVVVLFIAFGSLLAMLLPIITPARAPPGWRDDRGGSSTGRRRFV